MHFSLKSRVFGGSRGDVGEKKAGGGLELAHFFHRIMHDLFFQADCSNVFIASCGHSFRSQKKFSHHHANGTYSANFVNANLTNAQCG